MKRSAGHVSRLPFRCFPLLFCCVLAIGLFLTPRAAVSGKPPADGEYVAGELLVKFKPGLSDRNKDDLHRKAKGHRKAKLLEGRIEQIQLEEGVTVEDALASYRGNPQVEYAEPNYLRYPTSTPNDPRFTEQWALDNTGQTGGTPDADIDAPEAWNITAGSRNIVVAVVDTGVNYNHEDLVGNMWVNQVEANGQPGVDDDGNGYIDDIHGIDPYAGDGDPMDQSFHGTHVAGIIGATGNNGLGVSGVSPNVSILACRTGDWSLPESAILACFDYIARRKDAGDDIVAVNASFAGYGYSYSEYDGINALRLRGIILVASASNEGTDNDIAPTYPASFPLPNIISVTATNSLDGQRYNFGRHSVHVGAPGENILSTWISGDYQTAGGTSMAAPHVTGLAALLAGANPSRGWVDIKNRILAGGDPTGSLANTSLSGRRVNALGALTCQDSPLLAIWEAPYRLEAYTIGTPVAVSAISIKCGAPVGPVFLNSSDGSSIGLLDDGLAPDVEAGDGVFTGYWTPVNGGAVLTVNSPSGLATAVVPYVRIITAFTDPAQYGARYSYQIQATGDLPPYSWSLAGNVPAWLSIDTATGVLSGTPTDLATCSFSVSVTGSQDTSSTRALTLRVYPDAMLQEPTLPTQSGGGMVFTPQGTLMVWTVQNNGVDNDIHFEEYGTDGTSLGAWSQDLGGDESPEDLVVDQAGNRFISFTSNGNDPRVVKLSPSGAILWNQSFVYGSLLRLAVDRSGNFYLGATMGYNDSVTIRKGSPEGGLIWEYVQDCNCGDQLRDIAVDDQLNVYYVGQIGSGFSSSGFLTQKISPEGNLLWSSSFRSGAYNRTEALAVDRNGNVYGSGFFATWGGSPPIAPITYKYDASGNLAWTQVFTAGGWGGRGERIALDEAGRIYTLGYASRDSLDTFILVNDFSGALLAEAYLKGTYSATVAGDGHGTVFLPTASTEAGVTNYGIVPFSYRPGVLNHRPVAGNDSATTLEDTAVTLDLLANDTDPDHDALQVLSVDGAASGLTTLNADGTLTYFPGLDFNGTDSFTYTITDGTITDVGKITVSVTPANDPPVAVNDTASTSAFAPVIIPVLANDTDYDGDVLAILSATQGGHGTTAVLADGTIRYTPANAFVGTDAFTYTVGDGHDGTATAQVTVTVIPLPLRIASITMATVTGSGRTNATATVLAVNESGMVLAGVAVSGHWSGLTNDIDSGTTGADGKVALSSNQVRGANGTFTFNLDSAAKAGYEFDREGSVVVNAIKFPPPGPKMHVASIVMGLTTGKSTSATATVTVVDANNQPVSSAKVSGSWTDAVTGSSSGVTDTAGKVTLTSPGIKISSGKTFTFTVTNIAKNGATYDPAANVKTSGSIKAP